MLIVIESVIQIAGQQEQGLIIVPDKGSGAAWASPPVSFGVVPSAFAVHSVSGSFATACIPLTGGHPSQHFFD